MSNAPRITDCSSAHGVADQRHADTANAPGMAEAAAPFLPKPWVDLGPRRVEMDLGDLLSAPAAQVHGQMQRLRAAQPDTTAKRAMDLVVGSMALIFFAPLMALIACALLFERGPVLFVQTRLGKSGNRFACLKFRTMRPDAEACLQRVLAEDPVARREWARHQKLTNDPRITKLGRILRQSSLDELPQLWNVLRGEMSLVGPRPIMAPDAEGYAGDRAYFLSPFFQEYCLCRPGITGLWQVESRHSQDYAERLRQDRRYVRNWSLWLDVKILWRTIGVVLRRTGA